MRNLTMRPLLNAWLSHNRRCHNWSGVDNEYCRLNFNQAMRLCLECSFDESLFREEWPRALAAYQQGRPWDYLLSSSVYPKVAPLKPMRL